MGKTGAGITNSLARNCDLASTRFVVIYLLGGSASATSIVKSALPRKLKPQGRNHLN